MNLRIKIEDGHCCWRRRGLEHEVVRLGGRAGATSICSNGPNFRNARQNALKKPFRTTPREKG